MKKIRKVVKHHVLGNWALLSCLVIFLVCFGWGLKTDPGNLLVGVYLAAVVIASGWTLKRLREEASSLEESLHLIMLVLLLIIGGGFLVWHSQNYFALALGIGASAALTAIGLIFLHAEPKEDEDEETNTEETGIEVLENTKN